MELKSIESVSVARVFALLYAAFGLVLGSLFTVAALLSPSAWSSTPLIARLLIGEGAFLAFPCIYGLFGGISAGLGAVLYNVLASRFGGIVVEVGGSATPAPTEG